MWTPQITDGWMNECEYVKWIIICKFGYSRCALVTHRSSYYSYRGIELIIIRNRNIGVFGHFQVRGSIRTLISFECQSFWFLLYLRGKKSRFACKKVNLLRNWLHARPYGMDGCARKSIESGKRKNAKHFAGVACVTPSRLVNVSV